MNKIAVFIFTLFIISCEPDFDPNSEFVPTDVIYGDISLDEDKVKVLVFSAFTADEFDSKGTVNDSNAIYYQDSVILEILEYDCDHEYKRSLRLDKKQDNNFSSDVFNFSNRIYYEIDTTKLNLNEGCYYKLRLSNLKTEKVSVSEVRLLRNISFAQPGFDNDNINFIRNNEYLNYTIQIRSEDLKEYISNLKMYFIIETRKTLQTGGGVLSIDTLIYPMSNRNFYIAYSLPNYASYRLSSNSMFTFLLNNLDSIGENQWRLFRKIYFVTKTYSPELKEYIEAEDHFNSLTQYKPIYTNVYDENTGEEQLGLFYSHKTEKRFIKFNDTTMSFLDTSDTYKHLGF